MRLRARSGFYYAKIHQDPAHWASEVHAYEKWAPAFESLAPKLIGVREKEPLALLISALPGQVLEALKLPDEQLIGVWQAAGKALRPFHDQVVGEFFGPVHRNGTHAGVLIIDAVQWVDSQFDDWLKRGALLEALSDDELAVIRAVRRMLPAFSGEHPTPCHRDYCPANWLVTPAGTWAGIIDFEFSYWDVRAADFTRYAEWDWIDHPERIEAFFEGYGRSWSTAEEQQRQVCLALYALSAMVWGEETGYRGFAAEGRRALSFLGKSL